MSLRDWWSDLMAGDLVAVALLVIGGMLAALAYAVVKAVAGGLWSFGRSQVEQQFWRDGGKLTTLLSLTVLVLAYAFYGHEQPRPRRSPGRPGPRQAARRPAAGDGASGIGPGAGSDEPTTSHTLCEPALAVRPWQRYSLAR
ncbi:hypothetical protein [Dactylosporangium cerinum]